MERRWAFAVHAIAWATLGWSCIAFLCLCSFPYSCQQGKSVHFRKYSTYSIRFSFPLLQANFPVTSWFSFYFPKELRSILLLQQLAVTIYRELSHVLLAEQFELLQLSAVLACHVCYLKVYLSQVLMKYKSRVVKPRCWILRSKGKKTSQMKSKTFFYLWIWWCNLLLSCILFSLTCKCF